MNKNRVQKLKFIIAIFVVVVIIAFVAFKIIKYQTEGEKNMPFSLSKIIVISTAQKDTTQELNQDEQDSLWNFNVIQTNDIYISIEKNEENVKKDEKIKNITIENIQINEAPSVGTLKAYMPNSLEGENYQYTDEYLINESLTYRAADESNYKNLQICRNGGNITLSFANKEVGTYSSGEDTEITYDGTMLSKLNLKSEDIKSKISFDLIIELDDGKKYSGNVSLDLNCEGILENGKSQTEITDFSNIIFKRI